MLERLRIVPIVGSLFLLAILGFTISPVPIQAATLTGPIFINNANYSDSHITCSNSNCNLLHDIEAPYTAIFIMTPNIVLDLNGYTITYDTAGDRTGVMGINFFRYRNVGVALGSDNAYSQLDSGGNGVSPLIKNGKIVVGSSGGNWSTSLGSPYDTGIVTVYNVQLEANGRDGACVTAFYGEYIIHDVYCINRSTTTENRHQGPASFRFPNAKLTAYNNIIIGGNSAIYAHRNSTIYNNILRHASPATNGYGVFMYDNGGASTNIQIYNNIIAPTNGRGIIMNPNVTNALAYDNLITAHDVANAEFGEALNANCIRMRYSVTNNEFRNNKCLAIAGGQNEGATGIYLSNYPGTINYIHNNEFKSILTSAVTAYKYANSVALEGHGTATNFATDRIEDNIFGTNNYHYRLDGWDGSGYQSMIEDNTLEWVDGNSTVSWFNQAIDDSKYNFSYPISNSYVTPTLLNTIKQQIKSEIAGYISGQSNNNSRATFFTSYNGNAATSIHGSVLGSGVGLEPSDIRVWAQDRGSIDIKIGDSVTVRVRNAGGSNLANQIIYLSDNTGVIQTAQTDSNGIVRLYPVAYVLSKSVVGATATKVQRTSQSVSVSGYSPVSIPLGLNNDNNNPYIITFGSSSDTTPPSAITNLAVSNPTSSSLLLSWTSSGDDGSIGTASSYDLRYSTSPITANNFTSATQVAGEPTPSPAGTNQTMTVSGLTIGTTYYFAIKASDEAGNSATISNVPSGATTGTPPVLDTTAPAAITNLAISSPSSSSLAVSWTAPGDDGSIGTATGYDLRYSTSPITGGNFNSATAVTGEPAPAVAGTNQSMTVSGLSASTLYYFAIKASDEVPNTSAISNLPTGTTAAVSGGPDTTPPAQITNLAASAVTSSSLTLSWTAPGDDGSTGTAYRYFLMFSTSPIDSSNFWSAAPINYVPLPAIAGSTQSVSITGLNANSSYYFALRTRDDAFNDSSNSNIVSANTAGLPTSGDTVAPAAIFDLRPTSISSGTVVLSWTAPGDDSWAGTPTTYDARFSTAVITSANFAGASQLTGEPIPATAGTSQSMTISNLGNGTKYYYAIRVGDEVMNLSPMSNVTSATASANPTGLDNTPPATISNLASSNITSSSLTLTWTAPGNDGVSGLATTYDIRYSSSPITSANFYSSASVVSVPTPNTAGSSESLNINNLSAGTTYYFAIKATDSALNSSAISNVINVTTTGAVVVDTTAPSAISNLSIIASTQNSITIQWTAPGDDGAIGTASQYDIRYATSEFGAAIFTNATQVSGEPAPLSAGTIQSMTISGLSAGTTYYVVMVSSDEVANISGPSNIASGATAAAPVIDTTAPAAVSNLAVPVIATNTAIISWTAPGDDGTSGTAASYDLRYSTSPINSSNFNSATAVIGEPNPGIAGTAESMTITGLSAGTTYYFALKTSDEVPNTSAVSNIVQATTSTPPPPPDTTAPATVTNLAIPTVAINSVIITWTAPGDDGAVGIATNYDLRYSTSPITSANFNSATSVTGEPTPSVAGTAQSMTVSGLSAGTTYYFALKTSDEVPNTSNISNVVSATTATVPAVDTTAPAAVSNLAASAPTSSSLNISWTAPGDDGTSGTAASYDLRYSTSPINSSNFNSAISVTGEPAPAAAGTAQSMTVSGLSASTVYYFAIKTSDEVLNVSAISNIVSGTTSAAAVNPPPVGGGGGGGGGGATGDTTAPAAVTNLRVVSSASGVVLSWTAPGDDGNAGSAYTYDLRYSNQPIDVSSFDRATSASGEPAPGIAGSSQSMTIANLTPNVPYYFAVRTADEVLNWSALSNVPTITLAATTVVPPSAPATVSTIIITNSGTGTVTLKWIEPQSVNTITSYDVRYSAQIITEANFLAAQRATGVASPTGAGASHSVVIKNLTPNKKYYFTIKAVNSSGGSAMSKLVCTPRRLPLSLQTGQTAPDYCQAYSPYPRAKK